MFHWFFSRIKTKSKKLRAVSPENVRVGMVVKLPIGWLRHPFWTSRVRVKNEEDIEKILSLELPFVWEIIELEEQAGMYEHENNITQPAQLEVDESAKEIKQKANNSDAPSFDIINSKGYFSKSIEGKNFSSARVHHIKIQQCQKTYHKKLIEVKRLIEGVLTFSEETFKEASKTIEVMVDSLLNDPAAVLFLINARKKSEIIFHHALNTCMLSLLLGRDLGLSGESLCCLGIGVLFHDIGKMRIPKSILYKEKPLTRTERRFYQLHPQYGIEIASKFRNIPQEALEIIYSHHELLDGKGYPRRLRENEIGMLVRIATIVNLYDKYCNPRNPENAFTPHAALAHMYRKLTDKLDRLILERFIRLLGVYPPGTLVELNTGNIGVVIAKSHWSPKHLSVLVYNNNVPTLKAQIIPLWDFPDMKIIRSLRPEEVSPEVFQYLSPSFRVSYMVDTWVK